jgi:hypothetical protein
MHRLLARVLIGSLLCAGVASAQDDAARRAGESAASTSVSGIVLGPEGKPESGVRVSLNRVLLPWPDSRVERLPETVMTGPDGRFTFSTRRGLDLSVVAEKSGMAREEVEAAPLDPFLTVRMRHGFTVEGFVEGPPDRRIADCAVILEPVAFSAHRAVSTRTDRLGRFVFHDVPAGGARLTARHPDFRPATIPTVEVGTAKVYALRFTNERAFVLRSRVTTAGAKPQPIKEALVRALPSTWNAGLYLPVDAKTDASGTCVLGGLGPGNLRIEVRHPDYSTKVRQVAVSGENPELTFELAPRATVRGRVTGAKVRPGTVLELTQPGEPRTRTEIAADGTFSFGRRVSAGSADLALLDADICFLDSGSRWLTVQIDDDGATDLDLSVAPSPVVRGVVRDQDAQPLAGVRVSWQRVTDGPVAPLSLVAVTGADGRYEVNGLPRPLGLGPIGGTRFVFRLPGHAVGELEFASGAPGDDPVDLEPVTLVPPGTISGRVTRNGRGIAGAVVFAGDLRRGVQRDVSGPDGRFTLRDLAPGRYRVRASYATMPLVTTDDPIEVEGGGAVEGVELALPSGRTISGRVEAPDGAPIANALIIARGQRGTAFYAEADGTFALEVPSGDAELQVFASGDLHVQRTVRVGRDEEHVRIQLPMVPWGTVIAKVLTLPGRKPVAGGIVRIRALDGATGDETTDRQRNIASRWVETNGGELQLRFPAGKSELVFHAPGHAPARREIELAAGGTVDLQAILLEPGAEVRGLVTDESGKPIQSARVYLGHELDLASSAVTAAAVFASDGRFRIRGVGPLSSSVVVAAEGYATVERDLAIPDDLLRPDGLTIALSRGSTIAVTVDDAARNRDLSLVLLKKSGRIIDFERTDESGRAVFEHRGPGTYDLEVLGEASMVRRVAVTGEQDTHEVVIKTRDEQAQ